MNGSLIYILCDPRETDAVRRVRYVGRTYLSPATRLAGHLTVARRRPQQSAVAAWVRSLLDAGLAPTMEFVAEVDGWAECKAAESAWIAHYQALGCDLTNIKQRRAA